MVLQIGLGLSLQFPVSTVGSMVGSDVGSTVGFLLVQKLL